MQQIKQAITDYINTALFEYFADIQKDQITTQLSKGKILLSNLQFKQDILKKFLLPLSIKESKLSNVSITFGTKYIVQIEELYINIDILNLYGKFVMESSIKLKILDQFKTQLIDSLLKGFTQEKDKQQPLDPKKKIMMNIIQSLELDIRNISIIFNDNYCTKSVFGIKLEALTCKAIQEKQKQRNVEIKNLQIFWKDTVLTLNCNSTLDDQSQENQNQLSFKYDVEVDQLKCQLSKDQTNQIVQFIFYVQQFTQKRENQIEQKLDNDEEIKLEIKNIIKDIALTDTFINSEKYDRLLELSQTQSLKDLKQIQFEIIKYDKGEEIVQLRKKKMGWFGGMVKYDKKMSDKIINILEEIENDPNISQQFLSNLQINFQLIVNQFEIQLSSKYKGLDNILIINTQNAFLTFTKKEDFKLIFSLLSCSIKLSYGQQLNQILYKNEHFNNKNIIEIELFQNDQQENLKILSSPFQIILNQQIFEQYYDFYYFILLSQNHLPNFQIQAQQRLQQINQNKKQKEILVKLQKIYILSTNGKETFLFSPGSFDFQYQTNDGNQYKIQIQDMNFGFSNKIRSCIDFITEQYSMSSLIRTRDFKQITNCGVEILIRLQQQKFQVQVNLDQLNLTINPDIYKYFYLFYETHYQQPQREFLKQSNVNEDKKDLICLVSNKMIKQLECKLTFKGNYLNLYENQANKKIFKIDLRNIKYRESENLNTIALQLEKEEIYLEFKQKNEQEILSKKCLELRDDQFFMNELDQQQLKQQKSQIEEQVFETEVLVAIHSFQLKAENNQSQTLLQVEVNLFGIQNKIIENQSTLYLNLHNLEIYINEQNQQDSQILYIIGQQETIQQSMIEYDYILNGKQTLSLNIPFIILNYQFSQLSQILEYYPLHLNSEWSLTKFIINSYLTYYPDIQMQFNNLQIDIILNQLIYRKSELKQIALKKNEFKFRLCQDNKNQTNLQINGCLEGNYDCVSMKTSRLNLQLSEFTALFTDQKIQNKFVTSIKKKNNLERVILSPCNMQFKFDFDFDQQTIKNNMDIKIDQMCITFGAQDIFYFLKQVNKLFGQIQQFYDSYDLTQFLVIYRTKLFTIVAQIEDSIKVALIDDFFNTQLPFFGLVLRQPQIMLQSDLQQFGLKVLNYFEAWSYHQNKLVWEPVVEQLYLSFDLRILYQNQQITIQQNVQRDCNINLSTEFIKNVFRTQLIFQQFKLDDQKQQQAIPILKYNCYEIYNISGSLVSAQGTQNYEILNNKKIILTTKETLNFQIFGSNETIRIDNWQIDVSKTKEEFSVNGTSIIIETIVDEFMNSSKTFISTKAIIINQTNQLLNLKFKNQDEILLQPQKNNMVIDKSLKLQNLHILSSQQQKSSFQLIRNLNQSLFYDMKNVKQVNNLNTEFLQLNDSSYRIKCVPDPLLKQRTAISIGPIVIFQNNTPFSIILVIYEKQETRQIILMPNEVHENYNLNLLQEQVKYSFVVERFYESKKFSYGELQLGLRIQLDDEQYPQNAHNQGRGLKLCIKPRINNYGVHQILICYDYPYIINNTNLDIIIYQGNEKQQSIISGQKYHTAQSTLPLEGVKDSGFFLFDIRNQNIKNEIFKIDELSRIVSSFVCFKQSNNNVCYIPLQLECKMKQWGDGSILQIEIFFQYQIINKLQYRISLKYFLNKLSVPAGGQQYLHVWDKSIFNQEEQQYQCNIEIETQQNLLNIPCFNVCNYTQSILQLNNEKQEQLFVKVSIFEKANQQFLVLEEEKDTQNIPYVIVNDSQSLIVYLDENNEILKYKDKYAFANKQMVDLEVSKKVQLSNNLQKMPISFIIQCDSVGLKGEIEVGNKKYAYMINQIKQQKVITFSDVDNKQLQQQQQQFCQESNYKLDLKFIFADEIILSYIENEHVTTKELLITKISEVNLDLHYNQENVKVNFKMNRIQIDSQSKQMSAHKNILVSETQDLRNNLNIQFEITQFSKNFINFDFILFSPGNFQLAIDENFNKKSKEIQAQIFEIKRKQVQLFQNSIVKLGLHDTSKLDKKLNKRYKLNTVYVKKLILHPMDVKLSYLSDVYSLTRKHYVKEYIKSQPTKLLWKIARNYITDGGTEQILKTVGQFIQNKLNLNPTKLNYIPPIRPKRALFTLQKTFKPYQLAHSKAWQQIKLFSKNQNHNIKLMGFIDSFQIYNKGLEQQLFIFEMMLILHSNSTPMKQMNYNQIQFCFKDENNLILEIYLEQDQQLQLSFTSIMDLEIAHSNIERFKK